MTVFEIECRQKPAEDDADPKVISLYANSKSEALRLSRDPEATGVLLDAPTIYECSLATTTPVQTVLDLLNGKIKPERVALAHGTLPLPLRGR